MAGDVRHRSDQHLADDRVVLGPCAVGDVPGAESAKRRDDRVEVAQRLSQEDQRGEQHALLSAEIGRGEHRFDRGSDGEQPRVEGVHQRFAVGSDQVEARFEHVQFERHAASFRDSAPPRKDPNRRTFGGFPHIARRISVDTPLRSETT